MIHSDSLSVVEVTMCNSIVTECLIGLVMYSYQFDSVELAKASACIFLMLRFDHEMLKDLIKFLWYKWK